MKGAPVEFKQSRLFWETMSVWINKWRAVCQRASSAAWKRALETSRYSPSLLVIALCVNHQDWSGHLSSQYRVRVVNVKAFTVGVSAAFTLKWVPCSRVHRQCLTKESNLQPPFPRRCTTLPVVSLNAGFLHWFSAMYNLTDWWVGWLIYCLFWIIFLKGWLIWLAVWMIGQLVCEFTDWCVHELSGLIDSCVLLIFDQATQSVRLSCAEGGE